MTIGMPMDLPQCFVMAQSERSYRVPDCDGRRVHKAKTFQRRSSLVFLFSAMCFVAYPGLPTLYTPPVRTPLPHEQDNLTP